MNKKNLNVSHPSLSYDHYQSHKLLWVGRYTFVMVYMQRPENNLRELVLFYQHVDLEIEHRTRLRGRYFHS